MAPYAGFLEGLGKLISLLVDAINRAIRLNRQAKRQASSNAIDRGPADEWRIRFNPDADSLPEVPGDRTDSAKANPQKHVDE